ncbi:MAG: hypothetical protein ABEJ65_04620 [bacterium]
MAQQQWLTPAGRSCFWTLVIILAVGFATTHVHADEEITIEGENKQPTESTFEYKNKSDTQLRKPSFETRDKPRASNRTRMSSPELEKTSRAPHDNTKPDTGTLLKRGGHQKLLWGGVLLGLIIIVAAAG